jgi:hypothetical protein
MATTGRPGTVERTQGASSPACKLSGDERAADGKPGAGAARWRTVAPSRSRWLRAAGTTNLQRWTLGEEGPVGRPKLEGRAPLTFALGMTATPGCRKHESAGGRRANRRVQLLDEKRLGR